jgi:hypothetical protein
MLELTRRPTAFSVIALVALASLGCGADGLQRGAAKHPKSLKAAQPFPTRDTLDKLAQTPVTPRPAHNVAPASEWTFDATPVDAPPPVETHFAQAATKAGVALTYAKELRCVARELARFQLEHDAYPDERLKRFIVASCGLTTSDVSFAEQRGDAPTELTDEKLLTQWQSKLTVPPELKGQVAGVWMARKGKRVVIMTAAAKAAGEVVVSPADASGRIEVHGTAPAGTEMVLALVNQGDAAVARCEPDLATPLPLFAFHCTMAEGDNTTWIEVATRAQGRLLLRSLGIALARRDASAPIKYAVAARDAVPVTGGGDVSLAVLQGVNRARAAGKLAPLELAPNQAATNTRLAPHFFQSAMISDQAQGDVVGLGLLAGWDVQGTIRNGNLYAALLTGATDANAWLDYALEMPMGRFTMLEAGARQIAVGVAPPGAVGGIGAVVTTYEFFGSSDHRAESARVFDLMKRTRTARGLPAPIAIPGTKALGMQATLVNAGQKDASDALNDALVMERDRLNRSVRGWVIATNDLDSLPFPAELMRGGPVSVGVEVTHYREPGAAWGQYVVFLVMEDNGAGGQPSPQIQAAAESTRDGRL